MATRKEDNYPIQISTSKRFSQYWNQVLRSRCAMFGGFLVACWAVLINPSWGQAPAVDKAPENSNAVLLQVEFPLTQSVETRLLDALERISSTTAGGERPVVVLEFVGKETNQVQNFDEAIGRDTPFVRALSLARWLSGPKGSRILSVAYLPRPVCGHAVLVALACQEIAMSPNARLEQAGIGEPELDSIIRQAYTDIGARSAFPAAAVRSLLDPTEQLIEFELEDHRFEYMTKPEVENGKRPENAWKEEQLVPNNQMASFSSQQLRDRKWIAHRPDDRTHLSNLLKLSRPLTEQSVFNGPRNAIRVHVHGIISRNQINRIIRAIEEGLAKKETNLVVLVVDASGGNFGESLRLAQYLASIPAEQAEVVSYITANARGDAALIPLASDLIFMNPSARLGGPGEATITPEFCNNNKMTLQDLARSTGRSDGELLGCICPDMPIFEYVAFDGRTQLNSPQWLEDDAVNPQWNQGARIAFDGGLTFAKAKELGLASDNPASLDAVAAKFGLDHLPDETQTNSTEQFIEWLGGQGWLSMMLFLVGVIALSAELSTPGIGVAGILSAVCFLLFFWIHLFNGTVEWLEILLIGAGVVCIGIELFVLPGFGIFGATGLILLAAGLLLAGQTFVWPTNEYQWQRLAEGVGQLGLFIVVLFSAAIIFRKQLANLPMIRWLALQPPKVDKELLEKESINEQLRTFVGWHGKTLTRCNPEGKAMIGERIMSVSSDGSWIEKDEDIEVIAIHENKLIIKARA